MNPAENPLQQIADIITKGNTGVIVLPVKPTGDAVAAATALYLGLNKLSKNVSIACESSVSYQLTGVDKIQNQLIAGGDNLVISFPYTEGSIDKVDYNIQGSFFNLVITPRPGSQKIDQNQVRYTYAGGTFDFIITIDAPSLQALGTIYANKPTNFQNKTIINIDRHLINAYFGIANLVDKASSSTSELVLSVLQELQIELDRDIATNIYAGISAATNNFSSYSTNAKTFESAALVMKSGALKRPLQKPQPTAAHIARPPMQTPFLRPQPTQMQQNPAVTVSGNEKQFQPIESVEQEPELNDTDDSSSDPNAPQDWLKPKIFRGGGLI